MSTWERYALVRRDVAAAQARLDDGQNLDIHQWAAWVWSKTDMPTAPVATWTPDKGGPVYAVSYRLEGDRRIVNYYDPAQIADENSIWSDGALMADWLLMLEDDQWRYLAYNANHGTTTTKEGGAYYAQQARRILDLLRAGEKQHGLTAPLAPAASTPRRLLVAQEDDDDDPFAEHYRPKFERMPAAQVAEMEAAVRDRMAAARAKHQAPDPTDAFFAGVQG